MKDTQHGGPSNAEPTVAANGRPSSPHHSNSSPTPASPTIEAPQMGPQGGPIPTNAAGDAAVKQANGRSCKCSQPPTGKKGRNLVVFIDGTSNQFSMKNTNVVELYSRVEDDGEQLTYYNSGIGTFVKESWYSPAYWKQVISNGIDTAIAWNFKRIVLSAYQWLCENYEPGDLIIFLYGFSQGAYQVRVIAGMIEKMPLPFFASRCCLSPSSSVERRNCCQSSDAPTSLERAPHQAYTQR
ncbi:hypothetical protein FA95DRAFT_1601303 [Auriscalpium vulgare]|uniref:Uncharacterized protein n=1 Tax=Auriscalpium vulgare TaxID=40419 RepID=A0ACB8SAU0_9AGAM|nr:hypothetical protein FA95DRAFT_1601303 [Auriscalpium vulgare]